MCCSPPVFLTCSRRFFIFYIEHCLRISRSSTLLSQSSRVPFEKRIFRQQICIFPHVQTERSLLCSQQRASSRVLRRSTFETPGDVQFRNMPLFQGEKI
jgi:hypothetical protein